MSADSRVLDGPVYSSRLVHYPVCNLRRLSRPAVLFKERRYGEPIWDAGCREHELADRPSIDSGLRGPTRLSRMHCERGSLDLIYTGPVSRLSLGRTQTPTIRARRHATQFPYGVCRDFLGRYRIVEATGNAATVALAPM
jgi:hypothetical protein